MMVVGSATVGSAFSGLNADFSWREQPSVEHGYRIGVLAAASSVVLFVAFVAHQMGRQTRVEAQLSAFEGSVE